jgi:pyruvate dehydrogenase E1 component beta subunit
VRRPGRDLSLITFGGTLPTCLDAAEHLAGDGIDAEVIDLRSLRPLDDETIVASVVRTHRAVVVDEGWRSAGLSGEVSARLMEHAFYELDAPVARVCTTEIPLPYPRHLEQAALPNLARVVDACHAVMVGAFEPAHAEASA